MLITVDMPDRLKRCIDYEDKRNKKRSEELLKFSPEEIEKFDYISDLEMELQLIYKKRVKSAWLIGIGTVIVAGIINPILAIPAIFVGFILGVLGSSYITDNRTTEIKSKIDEILLEIDPDKDASLARKSFENYKMLKFGS